MSDITYKGKVELYNGKIRRFEFDWNGMTLDRFQVMDKASTSLNIEEKEIMDLLEFSRHTTPTPSIEE